MEKCKNITADHFNIDQEKYQIVFTSGASESNNAIIRSAVSMHSSLKNTGEMPIVISTMYEHKTTLECLKNLEDIKACKVIKLKPNTMDLKQKIRILKKRVSLQKIQANEHFRAI